MIRNRLHSWYGTRPSIPTIPTVGTGKSAIPPPAPVLVGSSVNAVNGTSVSVTLPTGILDGDRAALVWVGAPSTPSGADPFPIEIAPAGWVFEDDRVRSASMESYLYTRELSSTDSSQTVTVTLPSLQKSSLAVVVYRNVVGLRWSAAVYSNSATSHAAPPITTTVGSVIASVYTERGSAASTAITASPAGTRSAMFLTGGGATGVSVAASDVLQSPDTLTPGDWVSDVAQAGVIIWTLAFPNVDPLPPPPPDVANITYPVVAAHRFGIQEGPQNTLYTANSTLSISPLSIGECDIRMNASGTLVVWHDATVDGAAADGKTGNVSDYTDTAWGELEVAWPWGSNPAVPASTWAEILAAWGGRRVLMPEAKEDGVAIPLADSIIAANLVDATIVQSSDYARALVLVGKGLHVLYLCGPTETAFSTYASDGIEHVGYEKSNITSTICTDAHTAGLKVWAYSVNSTAVYDGLVVDGVDGHFSDKPTLITNHQLS